MAGTQNRVDTSSLFKGLIGKDEKQKQEKKTDVEEGINKSETKREVSKGRKPNEERLSQVSIYLTEGEQKELRVQGALREKEKDQSAIARMGIDIVLALSSEEYNKLKEVAILKEKEVTDIVRAALNEYL